ncbi:hypothetical protein [Microbacterium marinilacus]|uniref:GGDEF domain-containing protein n=1 Tax=Microbacterium marinilacus TaxID=415209 RepID=A0ABP7BLG2_9MICO|nr:hypothetical protein [Microbacterium marinilacus]MBY0689697.1 hypothetical protein [Microbacterium marinilacus]
MSAFDLFTLSFATAVVVITAGIVFLLDTVVRRGSASGRYWAASFLAGILVTFCYVAWAVDRDLWIAVATGNAAFVTQMGLMWLGCRVYNGRLGAVPRAAVALAALVTFGAAIVQRDVGDWAGAAAMFVGIGAFAALGAVETRRDALRAVFAAWGLTFALGAAAAYYAARTVVFLTGGPQSHLFAEWFSTGTTSIVTITLTIVAVVSTSVLRVASVTSPQIPGARPGPGERLLPSEVFLPLLDDVATRGERGTAPLTLIAVRVEGVSEIGAAFGQGAAERIEARWRDSLHRAAPFHAAVGAIDDATVGIALPAPTADEVASVANTVRQRLIDDLIALDGSVLPAIGVGFALAREHGYAATTLVDAARQAAMDSAGSSGMPVTAAPPDVTRP